MHTHSMHESLCTKHAAHITTTNVDMRLCCISVHRIYTKSPIHTAMQLTTIYVVLCSHPTNTKKYMHFNNNLPSVPPFDQSFLTKVGDQKTLQDKGNERQCLLVESIISLKATSSHEGKGGS